MRWKGPYSWKKQLYTKQNSPLTFSFWLSLCVSPFRWLGPAILSAYVELTRPIMYRDAAPVSSSSCWKFFWLVDVSIFASAPSFCACGNHEVRQARGSNAGSTKAYRYSRWIQAKREAPDMTVPGGDEGVPLMYDVDVSTV